MHEEYTDRLSDYLDDDLAADERSAVAAHLAGCPACTAVLNDLKRVVARAQALEPSAPAADLWPAIAARAGRIAAPKRFSFTIGQLAAAAVVLMAVSSTVAVRLATRAAGPAPPAQASAGAVQPSATAPDSDVFASATSVSFADAQYDAAVSDLERAVRAGRGRLDKATIDIVEHNLQIIDQAIAQARDALATDPANGYLSSHLVEARRRKLDLLRRAAALAEAN